MANLYATLRAIPGVRTVVLEAPREGESLTPETMPHVWCWEGTAPPPTDSGTDMLQCHLPVTVQLVFRHGDGQLRAEGRKWQAKLQAALAADIGRGRDETVNAAFAVDTSEGETLITQTPKAGFGVVHLDLDIMWNRHRRNPYGLTPPAVAA